MPKISDLPSTSSAEDADVLPVVDGGATKKVSVAQLSLAMKGEKLRGVPLAGSNGDVPPPGGTWVYNTVGGGSYKAKNPVPPGFVDVKDFGAVADYYPGNPSPTDNLAAFQAALAALKSRSNGTSTNTAGVLYADGHYYFSAALHIHQTVTIQGTGRVEPDNGSSSRSAPGTWLVWPDATDCIVVHGALNVSGGALGSSINDLAISSPRTATLPPTPGTGNAITAYTKAHVNRCTIENVGGCGFFLSCGSSPAVFEEQGEGWSVINCNIGGVGLDGIYIEGNDSGVGTASNNTLAVNGGFGIHDRSIGTNLYANNVGQDNFGNTDGSSGSYDYKADGLIPASTSSLFLNCYTENPSSNAVNKPAMIIGGGLSQAGNNPNGDALQVYPTGEIYSQPMTFHNQTSTPKLSVSLGGNDSNNLGLFAVDGQGYGRWYYSNSTGWWYWLDVNSTFMSWPTTKTQHRHTAPLFNDGLFFGVPNDLSGGYAGASAAIWNHNQAAGAPTTGTYERGDFLWEGVAGQGNPAGRACAVPGTLGSLSITGDTTSGSPDITNISNMSQLARWQYIDITGVGKRQIISDPVHPASPDTITVDTNCGATLTGTAIAWAPPTFEKINLDVVVEEFGKDSLLRSRVQTASTSTTTVASYAMADETMVSFSYEVVMSRRSTVSKAGSYRGKVSYRRTGGGAPAIVGAAVYDTDQETTAGDGVAFNVSSNDIIVEVTAADSDGRNWNCWLTALEVSNA